MLVSNQRPLPCESSAIVCWRFLESAKFLQRAEFLLRLFSQHFRRLTWVVARLLHGQRASDRTQKPWVIPVSRIPL